MSAWRTLALYVAAVTLGTTCCALPSVRTQRTSVRLVPDFTARYTDAAMLANVADLIDFSGLAPSRAATAEIVADPCALCGAMPLAPDASLNATLLWLEINAPEDALRVRADVEKERNEIAAATTGGRSGGPMDEPIRWTDERSRIAADSRVEAGYAMPISFLQSACARMDAALDEFVPDAFLAAICGNCACATYPVESFAPRLQELYIQRHTEGNEAAARRQPSWDLAERFILLVADIAAQHRDVA